MSKLGKIQANIQAHSNFFWVADGAHRLAILKYTQPFGNTIPMKYVELNFYICVQNKMKEMLKKTVEKSLFLKIKKLFFTLSNYVKVDMKIYF